MAEEILVNVTPQETRVAVLAAGQVQELLIERLAGGFENLSKPGIERLSDREMEVFQLIATGRNSREIAEHLRLSIKTIETYRANIKEKLKLRSGIDLMRAAFAMAAEHA